MGNLLLFLSVVTGCFCDVFAKIVGRQLPVSEIAFFRFFIGTIVLISIMKKDDYLLIVKPRYTFLNIIRSIFGVLSIWLSIYSIVYLKLVEVTTILWTIPMFELLFSRLFFNDKANRKQLLGAVVCFLSICAFSVDLSAYVSSYLLYTCPLLAAILFALQDVIIKKIGTDGKQDIGMMFSFSLVAAVCSLVLVSSDWIFKLSLRTVLYLVAIGICSQLTQYLLFTAFRKSNLTNLANTRYLEFIVQALCGFVFFNEVPTISNLICAVVLILTIVIVKR
ncbi:MAG: DMT family transporter [Alphaproteobacteria bacterium]|nr:DMT family transporter [Alphaproteobacteria bacterium]